jgi:hypothetical protein
MSKQIDLWLDDIHVAKENAMTEVISYYLYNI